MSRDVHSGGYFSLGVSGTEETPGLASPGHSATETSMAIDGGSASQPAALVMARAKAAADSVACHV